MLRESCRMTFNRMGRFASLTLFAKFQNSSDKLLRIKFVFMKSMFRVVKGTKICSIPRIFKTYCAKRKHGTKRNMLPD